MKIPEGLRRIFRVFSSSYGVFCEVRALEIENHFQEEKLRLPAQGCPSPWEERPASWTPAWLEYVAVITWHLSWCYKPSVPMTTT